MVAGYGNLVFEVQAIKPVYLFLYLLRGTLIGQISSMDENVATRDVWRS